MTSSTIKTAVNLLENSRFINQVKNPAYAVKITFPKCFSFKTHKLNEKKCTGVWLCCAVEQMISDQPCCRRGEQRKLVVV